MNAQYAAVATSSGGREGHVRSSDGVLDLPLSMPKELGGSGKHRMTNPERLFAPATPPVSSTPCCAFAWERKVKLNGSSVSATVGIGRREAGRFGLEVALAVSLQGVDRAEAEVLARTAHEEVCMSSVPGRAGATLRCRSRWSSGPDVSRRSSSS